MKELCPQDFASGQCIDLAEKVIVAVVRVAADDGQIVGVSHQDLAAIVGTYRETVTRILNEFRNEGYVDLGRLNVTILKPDALRAIAEE